MAKQQRLEGTVTWQPGDQISNSTCTCVCCFVGVFEHMMTFSSHIWWNHTFPPRKRLRYLVAAKWRDESAFYVFNLFYCPCVACPPCLLTCSVCLQGGCLWGGTPPWSWSACSWMTRDGTIVGSSYWTGPQMSCGTARGLCSLCLVRFFLQSWVFCFQSWLWWAAQTRKINAAINKWAAPSVHRIAFTKRVSQTQKS